MTGPTHVEWTEDALDDWKRLSLAEARAVAEAVQRWATTGAGIVIAAEGSEYLLFVGEHVVEFLVDTSTHTMHVCRVRRS
jgi:hypothetical protein